MSVESIPFQTLSKSSHDGPVNPVEQMIRNSDELQKFYELLGDEDIPPPLVDFDRKTVIAVARGTCETEGYGVAIQRVIPKDGKLAVIVENVDPPEGGMLTAASYPWHVITIDKYEGAVEFNHHNVISPSH